MMPVIMAATGAFPTSDLALAFSGVPLSCDLVFADGDLVLADTPVTPLLVSLGSDRRAAADDTLPQGITPLNMPVRWNERRGWAGDALDRAGRRIGSRLWLLDREKATEETRLKGEGFAAEATAWLIDEFGITPEIEVSIVRINPVTPMLQIIARVDGHSVTLRRRLVP